MGAVGRGASPAPRPAHPHGPANPTALPALSRPVILHLLSSELPAQLLLSTRLRRALAGRGRPSWRKEQRNHRGRRQLLGCGCRNQVKRERWSRGVDAGAWTHTMNEEGGKEAWGGSRRGRGAERAGVTRWWPSRQRSLTTTRRIVCPPLFQWAVLGDRTADRGRAQRSGRSQGAGGKPVCDSPAGSRGERPPGLGRQVSAPSRRDGTDWIKWL